MSLNKFTIIIEADLGIDTVKQAELLSLIRERYGLAQDDAFKLSDVPTLTAVAEYVASTMQAVPEAAEPVAAAPAGDLLVEIQALFAEQTGYDVDDLDPAFELEADLGIDTVKQAELLSLLRERYGLLKDDTFKLSDVPTLNAVVEYVASKLQATVSSDTAATAAPAPHAAEQAAADQRFTAREVAAVRLDEPLPAPRSLAGRRIAVAGGDDGWRSAVREALEARDAKVHLLSDGLDPEREALQALRSRLGDIGGAPVDDVVFLAEENITLDPSAIEAQVEEAFSLARAFARSRGEMTGAGFLVLGRSQGLFGFGSDDATGVAMGALAGLTKTLAREWPEAACLAADLDGQLPLADGVNLALDAWSRQTPTEIAWHGGAAWTLRRLDGALSPGSAVPFDGALDLPERPVVVATGGARGVTHRVLMEMARRKKLCIEILARTDGVQPADSPLAGKSEAEQKELARAAVTAAGERSTPLAIKRWIGQQALGVDVARNLEALRELGCDVTLVVCDVADDEALRRATGEVRSRHETVDILLHGAGCEESKLITDKDDAAFTRIFAPKARAALRLSEQLRPRRFVTMGSVAGRFGNAGQTDYAAANELLAAWSRYGGRGVLNLAWTAWDEVGMAMAGSTKRILESAGVDLLPPDVGARIAADLILSGAVGDLVVAGALGSLDETEPNDTGTAVGNGQVRVWDELPAADRPWIFDRIEDRSDKNDGAAVYVRRLDASRDPGLDDHRIDGVAVLPGVLGLELMTKAAEHHAGRTASALERVEFRSPLKLYRDEPVEARVEVRTDGDAVSATLVSVFTTPAGKTRRREHFAARVLFGERAVLKPPAPWELELPRDPEIDREQIYARYFHGPRFQVVDSLEVTGEDGATVRPALDRGAMLGGEAALTTSPRLREAGFQAAGVWEMLELGRMALPSGIDRIELGAPIPAGTELWIEARKRSSGADGARFDIWVRDDAGVVYDVMHGYRTALFRDLEPDERFEPATRRGAAPAWLFVDIDEVRELLLRDPEAAVERYLSAAEQARFAELKTDKRRVDWLAGRIAAKRLIRETRFREEGAIVTFPAISILADELGAPEVHVIGEPLPHPHISISHGAGVAVAFLSSESQQRPGIDVERVVPRAAAFINDYFTDAEREQASATAQPERAFTERWAVKEATLKALGIGARVDFRDVEVRQTGDAWKVALRGEAHERARAIGAGEPSVEVHSGDERVVARVLLPTGDGGAAKAGTATEATV